MLEKQKETILKVLKQRESTKNYIDQYWFSYEDFLNPEDAFTDFACENFDGKQGYLDLIQNLRSADEIAKIFVDVYGYEEDRNEQFIHAETLIIFSKLSLAEIEQIFHESEDIFPSDIGEETDFSRQCFIVDKNGDLSSAEPLFHEGYFVYYCWWD